MAIIIKTPNDETYEFYSEDTYVDYTLDKVVTVFRDVGNATMRTDDEGHSWFEGRFDTQSIGFVDNNELESIVKRFKSHEEVYFI